MKKFFTLFIFEYKKGDNTYFLNTSEIKDELDDVPINTPDVIKLIKDDINTWLNEADNVIE